MVTQTGQQDPQEIENPLKEDPKEDAMIIVAKAEVIVVIGPKAEVLVAVLPVVFQETVTVEVDPLLVIENQDLVLQIATADPLLVIENHDLVLQTVIAGPPLAIENHPLVLQIVIVDPLLAIENPPLVLQTEEIGLPLRTEDLNAERIVVLHHLFAEKVVVMTEREVINVAIIGLPKEELVLVQEEVMTIESPIGAKESLIEMDFNAEKEKMIAEEKDLNAIVKEVASEVKEMMIGEKEALLEEKDPKEDQKELNSEIEAVIEGPIEKPRDLVMKTLIEDLMAKEAALLAPDPVPIVPKGKNAEAISVAMTAMQEAVTRLAKDLTEEGKAEKEVPEVSATETQEATEVQEVFVKEAPMATEAPAVRDPQEEEKDL